MHYVYILRSQSSPDQTYIGATTNLENRLSDHNAGRSPHTSKIAPWVIEFHCGVPEKKTALEFETYLKSHSGRAFANKRLLRGGADANVQTAKISRLTRHDDAAFDALVAIYQASIETSEQKPVEVLRRAVDDPRYRFLIARHDNAVTGFAICFAPAPDEIWLLEYMAIDATRRSGGVGAALLQACIELHRTAGRPIGLLEVDAVSGDAAQRDQRTRRLAFYRRNGCRVIEGLDYILPLPGAPAMRLLVHAPADLETIDKTRLEEWIAAIYREVYAQPANDPRPARMVAPLPDPARLAAIDETARNA